MPYVGSGEFVGAELRGRDFAHREYVDCDLSGADLEEADLTNTIFRRCKLVGTTLRTARAHGAKFLACDLARVDARGLDLTAADLDGCTGQGGRFDQAKAAKTTIYRCDLAMSSWIGADLTRAEIFETNFGRAILDDVQASNAKLVKVDLDGASMRDANVTDAFFDEPRTASVVGAPLEPWTCTGKNAEVLYASWNAARAADPRYPAAVMSPAREDVELINQQIVNARPDLDPILGIESLVFDVTTTWFHKVAIQAVIAKEVAPPRLVFAFVDEQTDTHPLEGALDVFSRFARAEGFTLAGDDVVGYAQLALYLTGRRTTRDMAVISREGAAWDVSLRGWHSTDLVTRVSVQPDGTVWRN